jgi:hypothetical protein
MVVHSPPPSSLALWDLLDDAPRLGCRNVDDASFWQSLTPEDRLSALVAIRRDVEAVEAGRGRRNRASSRGGASRPTAARPRYDEGEEAREPMSEEIIFAVDESPEGGYEARALSAPIFTEADSLDDLRAMVRDAVACHFEGRDRPKIIRLHFVRDELMRYDDPSRS